MSDILDNPFDPFADAVEASLLKMREEIRAMDTKIAEQQTEIRSLREELQTRAVSTALVKPLEEVIREEMARVEFRATPCKDGKDGIDGKDGRDGIDGKDGAPGERGADGINGRDGAPGEKGERGADGIASREELESIVEARFADLTVRSFADAYSGVWKEGLHKRGVFTTWGGSLWLSLADTENKPGENGDWRLVVKKGADAKR